jgi:type II secretory pathway pseudopilin PulG
MRFEQIREKGFTLPEVIIAGVIMIILGVGLLSAYTFVIKLNHISNVRAQALTVLQREVEQFRSFRFVPGTTDARLNAGDYPNYKIGELSVDGFSFNISVKVDNDPFDDPADPLTDIPDIDCKFKQIKIVAVLQNAPADWSSNLSTEVEIQRVRSN